MLAGGPTSATLDLWLGGQLVSGVIIALLASPPVLDNVPDGLAKRAIQTASAYAADAAVLSLLCMLVVGALHVALFRACVGARPRTLGLVLLLAVLLLHPSSPLFLSFTWQWQTYVDARFFSHVQTTGDQWSKLRIVPSHRLLFCAIEKNANTAFEDLLCSLSHADRPQWMRWTAAHWRTWADFELDCRWASTYPLNQGYSMPQAIAAFKHVTPGWTSAVFLRDPLERFLSGWLSKCTPGHDLDREVCTKLFGSPNASFAHAAATIGALSGDVPDGVAEDHFRLQSAFCGGAIARGEFDLVYVLDRATSRDNVADMLRHVGITQPTKATSAFNYHFRAPPSSAPPAAEEPPAAAEGVLGVLPPLTDAHGGNFEHTTNAHSRRALYYSDPVVVRAVLRHYAPDYRTLPKIRVPSWVVDVVGADYVRSLGLDVVSTSGAA